MPSRRSLTLLVVDDDEVDRRTMVRAVRRHDPEVGVVMAGDGQEALDLLRGAGPEPLPWPHLVLLDLNMPVMDGHEFLDALRADPRLAGTVVVVVTTSSHDADLVRAYDRQVAGYVVKTANDPTMELLVKLIEAYRRTVLFPAQPPRLQS